MKAVREEYFCDTPHGKTSAYILLSTNTTRGSTEYQFYQVKRGERSVSPRNNPTDADDVSSQGDGGLDSTKLLFEQKHIHGPIQCILQRDTRLVLLHSTSYFLTFLRPNKTIIII